MKKFNIILAISCLIVTLQAQKYVNYSFNSLAETPVTDTLHAIDGTKILLERRIIEVIINKEKMFEELYIFHKKTRVETTNAVSANNKIYIGLNKVLEIKDIQARFISKDGKITSISKENIKEIENLENKGNFKTFAIEGAEAGGIIEYFYVLRKTFSAHNGYNIQDETPRSLVEIILTYPKKIEYIYSYNNGFPEFTSEETDELTTRKAVISNLKGIREEKYANYAPHMLGFDYCMAYNSFNSNLRINNWAKSAQNIYDRVYTFSSKEISTIAKLLTQINPTQTSTEGKIREIENWVKANFKVDKNFESQPTLALDIKLKQLNSITSTKLYIGLFQAMQIPFELVQTGDKTIDPFKPHFNAPNFLDYTLFYFPEIKKYLTPEDDTYRLGVTPTQFQGGYGLFMQPIAYNEKLKTLGYELGQIPVQPSSESLDSMVVKVTIEPESATLRAEIDRVMYGTFGRMLQSFIHLMDNDRKKEFVADFFKMGKEKSDVSSFSFDNSAPENIGYKPIICKVDQQNKFLIDNAGTDLLVKIGETIGQQSELYQENKRELPIEMPSLHNYYREIQFTIPAGYSVANLNDLQMNVELINNQKQSCYFTSVASISGNVLTIISKENYTESLYDKSRYEEFRKVINAAADFNKKTILLKKV